MSETKSKFRLGSITLAVATLMLLVGGLVYALSGDINSSLKDFEEVAFQINSRYVDEISSKDLVRVAIKGMLDSLDPYSEFLDQKDLSSFIQDTQGEFEGLGIEIDVREDYIVIISPLEGTPAYRMGLQAGDRIIEIEGKSTQGITAQEALSRLRGKKGTRVNLTILRQGTDKPMSYDITRDVIEIKSVPYYGLTREIGYVRLNRFAETSGQEVRDALRELELKKPKGIILDLRSNPGGLLNSAVEVAGFFLGKGKLIVETRGRDITQNRKFFYNGEAVSPDLPLVVLVDEGSASASEIVAGSIQDWDRGIVVGKTTFGKGLVQTLIDLSDGSGLKLTTAKYYIPSGRCIQKPREKEDQAITMSGTKAESADTSKKEEFFTGKGRKVFGGGGIAPDVEVEGEKFNSLEFNLLRKQMFFEFALGFTAGRQNIPRSFTVDDKIIGEFRQFLKDRDFQFTTAYQLELDKLKQSIEENPVSPELKGILEKLEILLKEEKEKEFEQSSQYIRFKIKEEILSKLYGREAMYKYVWVDWHPEILKAVELITDGDRYQHLLSVH